MLNIDIDFDDSIFYNGNKVSMDDLPGYFQQEAAKIPQPEIHLRPEKRSHYDTTAKVLAAAQRNGMTKLGIDIGGLKPADRDVEGVVEMMLDATQGYDRPLTKERLFDWHAALFPTGRSGMTKIGFVNTTEFAQ